MKHYAYYPGCSLENMAKSYNVSTVEVADCLGLNLHEIDDWNCCGATAYYPVDELLANTLVSRNLALAEKQGATDFVTPCSACFKNAYFTNEYLRQDRDLAEHMNYALEADKLHVDGRLKVRHLIEVILEDVGLEGVSKLVKKPLKGLKVAPYYGCQLLRPRKDHENTENPNFFEDLLEAIGSSAIAYGSKTRCCGGSLIITNRKAALDMVRILLEDAVSHEADLIATVCPMCNINLEVYQSQVNHEFGTEFSMPVMYFTQLMGVAFGLKPAKVGIGQELIAGAPLLAYAAN
jgi:heterodisulfide reductase subunit B